MTNNSQNIFSGVLFLRNYLRKKSSGIQLPEMGEAAHAGQRVALPSKVYNTAPVPYPPEDSFYGPIYIPDEMVG